MIQEFFASRVNDVSTGTKKLDELVHKHILLPFDKSYLNDKLGNTSGEIIAENFYGILKAHIPQLSQIALRETLKNSFFVGEES